MRNSGSTFLIVSISTTRPSNAGSRFGGISGLWTKSANPVCERQHVTRKERRVSGKAAPSRRGVASLPPPPDEIDPDLDPGSDPDQSRGSWLWEPRYREKTPLPSRSETLGLGHGLDHHNLTDGSPGSQIYSKLIEE
jgi:hypothetical protein